MFIWRCRFRGGVRRLRPPLNPRLNYIGLPYLSKMLLLTCLFSLATFLHICQARSLANESSSANPTDETLWQPAEGTREEWMACRGMPKDVCERTKIKKQELQQALAKKFGLDVRPASRLQDPSPSDSGVGQCIMYTEEQLDMMIDDANSKEDTTSTNRRKRNLIDFKKYTYNKWSMPIPYMFDGTHDDNQKATIRSAFQYWADNTCIRFRELPTKSVFNSNYILMTKIENDGCYSSLGRINRIPQQINLDSSCVVFGVIIHEIGHALGLVHEQSRLGRNESITVLWNNIQPNEWSQYAEASYTDALGLPYNYGSVMHYPSKGGVGASPGVDTMLALQPLYQMNMGQAVDLSFHDKKIINLGYCTGTCATPLSQTCQRGGYQNPNNCSTCICPSGFAGQYCSEIAQPKNANCGGILNIASGTQQVIKSPGYDTTGYSELQDCTWWIKAPMNNSLELTFNGSFGILYSTGSACAFHWAEIKYKKDLGLEGARFCGNSRPSNIVTSESNEMMIIFRSNYSWKYYQRGFQAIVKSIPTVMNSSSPPSTPASTSRTSTTLSTKSISSSTLTSTSRTSASSSRVSTASSSTTTRSSTSTKTTPSTTTTTTTTTSTTTLAPIAGNGGSLFRCSFEKTTSSGDSLCGMTQDTTDQFDWTVYKDPTPSDPTGPDAAYDGSFYIYIEASDPRKLNDEARLFVPKLNFGGDVCVDFYYHMYGFHINTLKLVRITGSQSTVVWSKTGQIGNFWNHASVGVNLSTNSQLQFVGIRGDEYSGDIGLDKIEVKSGRCVA